MIRKLDEGNLQFDFSAFQSAERFDDKAINAYGLKAVDFVAEDADSLYFIEVKDFQHPNATSARRKADNDMLNAAVGDKKAAFPIEMGVKIKDSLLRKYALGEQPSKSIVYLLVINSDKLGERERGLLKEKIGNHVPTGLNESRFSAFKSIKFDLVNSQQLRDYSITCSAITEVDTLESAIG